MTGMYIQTICATMYLLTLSDTIASLGVLAKGDRYMSDKEWKLAEIDKLRTGMVSIYSAIRTVTTIALKLNNDLALMSATGKLSDVEEHEGVDTVLAMHTTAYKLDLLHKSLAERLSKLEKEVQ